MNSEQAKNISLPDLMARLGYQPTKITKGGIEYWYVSPFRSESEPSFHTSYLGGKWIWKDFGDRGGTVIDFVMRHENYTNVKQALAFLDALFSGQKKSKNKNQSSFSFQQQSPAQPTFKLEKVIPLERTLSYLTDTRKLDAEIVKKYLMEVYFWNTENGKLYFAPGIQNRAGGYEIRNLYFKSCVGKKDFTFLKGEKSGTCAWIFEGFIDFLSFLTHKRTLELEQDTIILNSVSFGHNALAFIQESNYTQIQTFFDNDRAGRDLLETFRQGLGLDKIYPMNFLYEEHSDYNEMLTLKK